jgi:hypothetical protein
VPSSSSSSSSSDSANKAGEKSSNTTKAVPRTSSRSATTPPLEGKPAAQATEAVVDDEDSTRGGGDVAGRSTTDENDEKGEERGTDTDTYVFEGRTYASYQEMVNAKRSRNQQMLIDSGLLDLAKEVAVPVRRVSHDGSRPSADAKKRKAVATASTERLKSNRLAGIQSDGVYVEEERAGRFLFATKSAGGPTTAAGTGAAAGSVTPAPTEPEQYRGRINDGAPLSIEGAVRHLDARWIEESTVPDAERFVRGVLAPARRVGSSPPPAAASRGTTSSKASLSRLQRQVDGLGADDETLVAKVTPDRIYGMAVHPSPDSLIVCAGDKTGCVGMWKVPSHDASVSMDDDSKSAANHSPAKHLFRLHNGAASCLQWTSSGSKLFSASYDGTIRCLDVTSEAFEQVFATYDDSSQFQDQLGRGMDTGYRFWTQYACLDPRSGNGERCVFVSTSIGTAMHLDLRASNGSGRVTFHEELSEKKINSLR